MKRYLSDKTAIIDEYSKIGEGNKIWHFSHIMSNCKIGNNCNIGQNVVISPKIFMVNNVRIQNILLIYERFSYDQDVFLVPYMGLLIN